MSTYNCRGRGWGYPYQIAKMERRKITGQQDACRRVQFLDDIIKEIQQRLQRLGRGEEIYVQGSPCPGYSKEVSPPDPSNPVASINEVAAAISGHPTRPLTIKIATNNLESAKKERQKQLDICEGRAAPPFVTILSKDSRKIGIKLPAATPVRSAMRLSPRMKKLILVLGAMQVIILLLLLQKK